MVAALAQSGYFGDRGGSLLRAQCGSLLRAHFQRENLWHGLGAWCEDGRVSCSHGDRLAWSPPSSRTDRPSAPRRPAISIQQGAGCPGLCEITEMVDQPLLATMTGEH